MSSEENGKLSGHSQGITSVTSILYGFLCNFVVRSPHDCFSVAIMWAHTEYLIIDLAICLYTLIFCMLVGSWNWCDFLWASNMESHFTRRSFMLKILLICTTGASYFVLVRYFILQNILQFCQKSFPSFVTTNYTHKTAVNTYFHFFSLLLLLHNVVVPCTVGLLFSLDVQFLVCTVFYHSSKKKISFLIGRWEYDYLSTKTISYRERGCTLNCLTLN